MSKFVFALSAFTSRYFPWSPWSASRWLYVAHTQEKKVNTVNIRWCELQQLPNRKAFWIACAIGSRHRDIISALEVIEFSTSLVTTAYFLLTYWSRLSNVPSKSNQQSSCYWHATASCPCFSFHPFFFSFLDEDGHGNVRIPAPIKYPIQYCATRRLSSQSTATRIPLTSDFKSRV